MQTKVILCVCVCICVCLCFFFFEPIAIHKPKCLLTGCSQTFASTALTRLRFRFRCDQLTVRRSSFNKQRLARFYYYSSFFYFCMEMAALAISHNSREKKKKKFILFKFCWKLKSRLHFRSIIYVHQVWTYT